MALFSGLGALMGAGTAQAGGQRAAGYDIMGGILGSAAAQGMFQQGMGYVSPFMAAGQQVQPWIASALGTGGGPSQPGVPVSGQLGVNRINATSNPFDPNAIGKGYRESPGYQFQLGQGMQGLNASAAARGGLLSGANIKAGETFAQGLANQDYWNYIGQMQRGMGLDYSQRADAYNRLFGQQAMGAQLAGQALGAATGTGATMASALSGSYGRAGGAISSAADTAAGIYSGAGQKIGGEFGSWFGGGMQPVR